MLPPHHSASASSSSYTWLSIQISLPDKSSPQEMLRQWPRSWNFKSNPETQQSTCIWLYMNIHEYKCMHTRVRTQILKKQMEYPLCLAFNFVCQRTLWPLTKLIKYSKWLPNKMAVCQTLEQNSLPFCDWQKQLGLLLHSRFPTPPLLSLTLSVATRAYLISMLWSHI